MVLPGFAGGTKGSLVRMSDKHAIALKIKGNTEYDKKLGTTGARA